MAESDETFEFDEEPELSDDSVFDDEMFGDDDDEETDVEDDVFEGDVFDEESQSDISSDDIFESDASSELETFDDEPEPDQPVEKREVRWPHGMKRNLLLTSFVGAIPAAILVILMIKVFLSYAGKTTAMLLTLAGVTLAASTAVALTPFGILLFSPKELKAPPKEAKGKGADGLEPGEAAEEQEPAGFDDAIPDNFDADDLIESEHDADATDDVEPLDLEVEAFDAESDEDESDEDESDEDESDEDEFAFGDDLPTEDDSQLSDLDFDFDEDED